MSAPESRVVPADEKTCPAHLVNAEGYRQILALRFAIGDKVHCAGDEYTVREVTSIELTLQDTILYGLDFREAIWCDEELTLVEVKE